MYDLGPGEPKVAPDLHRYMTLCRSFYFCCISHTLPLIFLRRRAAFGDKCSKILTYVRVLLLIIAGAFFINSKAALSAAPVPWPLSECGRVSLSMGRGFEGSR